MTPRIHPADGREPAGGACRAGARENLARLVDSLGTARLGEAMLAFLRGEVRCDSALVLLYHPRRRPLALAEALAHPLRRNDVEAYLGGAYLLDPFRAHAATLTRPAVVRLADIAPSDFVSSEYFQSYYKDSNLSDEVNVLVPVVAEQVLAVSLGRSRSLPPFERSDLDRLQGWLPLLAAVCGRHTAMCALAPEASEDDDAIDREHDRLEARLAGFGAEVLTPREREIVQLLLKGFSTPLIARELAVSAQTVRVHRRNIYDKLDVSSLGQLFSLAMRALLGEAPDAGVRAS